MEVAFIPKVKKFITELPAEQDARVKRNIRLLQSHGHLLRFPDSRQVARGLFELRILGAVHIRFLYFFYEDRAIIVHCFMKKQRKLSRKDIEYAFKARNLLLG
jgi:phage-related protein